MKPEAEETKPEAEEAKRPDGDANKPKKKRGPLRRGLTRLGQGLLVLLVVLIVKALATRSRQVPSEPMEALPIDEAKAAEHLGRAITFQTVSHLDPSKDDPSAFTGLRAALKEMYPRTHQTLSLETVGGHSLLYTWKGKDPSRPPVLLMGHQDVVPVEPGTEAEWQKPPFSGAIEEGYVWGRGAMDDKMAVVGLLEAVEALLEKGHAPERTIYLAFGHDEEVGGTMGAKATVALLASRNVHLAYVLDEGMVVTQGMIKGIDRPIALIGVAEKGYVSVELIAEGEGGHSSMPPRPTSAGILAAAILRLEQSQMPARIEGPARMLFDTLAPEMGFRNRLILSNLWLLSPIAKSILAGSPATAALLRTTTAPTMLEGSVKDNVLPKRARAVVNFRILPGDSVAKVLEHVKSVVDDKRVEAKVLEGSTPGEPSPVSDITSPGYKSIEKTIRQVFPEAIVAPSLVLGATDSHHYQSIADGVYRFAPQRMGPEDRPRFHGTNERLGVKNLAECVQFYGQLIRNADKL